jgi:hypothetical protein
MRKLLFSTVVLLAGMAPAFAQDAPIQAGVATAAQNQQNVLHRDVQSFGQRIQKRLTQAGFSNIEMVPTSILVRATDRDGNPVMMALSTGSLAELLEVSGQNDGTATGVPTGRPAPTAGEAK